MMELKRRHMNVLRKLAESPHVCFGRHELPNGHGLCFGNHNASFETVRELRDEQLVEFGRDTHYGYRITEDGIKAIEGKS